MAAVAALRVLFTSVLVSYGCTPVPVNKTHERYGFHKPTNTYLMIHKQEVEELLAEFNTDAIKGVRAAALLQLMHDLLQQLREDTRGDRSYSLSLAVHKAVDWVKNSLRSLRSSAVDAGVRHKSDEGKTALSRGERQELENLRRNKRSRGDGRGDGRGDAAGKATKFSKTKDPEVRAPSFLSFVLFFTGLPQGGYLAHEIRAPSRTTVGP